MTQDHRHSGFLRPHATALWLLQRTLDAALIVAVHYLVARRMLVEWQSSQLLLVGAAVLGFQFVAEINGVYGSWRTARLRDEVAQTVWSWFLIVPALAILLLLAFDSTDQTRTLSFMWWLVLTPTALATFKIMIRTLVRGARVQGRNSRVAAIAGATPAAYRLVKELRLRPEFGIRVSGVYDDRAPERIRQDLGGAKLLGDLDRAVADARSGRLDVLYITLPFKAETRISEIVSRLADTTATVHLVADFSSFEMLHGRFGQVAGLPTVSIFDTPFDGLGGYLKRLEDLVLGSLILTLIAPIMGLIALLVKLDSKGPVFFAQTRCGLNGKPFKVYKFRSMTATEDGNLVVQARRNDRRVTRLGAFLRRTSLDELPQFWNVIKGDMSIVGPRPHASVHNEQYRGLVHRYMLRHKVKPGITGWAQVNGWRGETETVDKMQKRVEYDLHYIENWSLSWDIEIILKTALSLTGKNAY